MGGEPPFTTRRGLGVEVRGGSTAVTDGLLYPLRDSRILCSVVEKDLKRIVKPVMDAQPAAPSAIIADIVLIEHRGMLHGWLVGQIEAERKRQSGEPPSRNRSGRKAPDPRQGWFDLPEFQHVRDEVKGDSLEEFDARIEALKHEIRLYDRPRVSVEKKKADRRELREMLRLKKVLVPFFVDDPTMTIGPAFELYKKQQQTARAKRQRKAGKARWSGNTKSTT